MNLKWYYSTWFIALLFSQWYLIVPLLIGIILLIKKLKEEKLFKQFCERSGLGDLVILNDQKEIVQKEIISLEQKKENIISDLESKKQKILSELEVVDNLNDIRKASKSEEKKRDEMMQEQVLLAEQIETLKNIISKKEDEIVVIDDEIFYQDFGFYAPKFNLENSKTYKEKLAEIRNKQKQLAKDKIATHHFDGWEVNGNKAEGRKMNNDNIQMTLYSFNTDCDNAIMKAKFNNIDSIEKRILNSYKKLNKMNQKNRIEITKQYLNLKLDELHLAYEYEKIKEEEREEQQRIKEEMREEQKAQKEIDALKKKIEKEEKHFQQEIVALRNRIGTSNALDRENLQHKILELEAKLALVEKDKQDVHNREQNTRAGYVYIISNIGSFGEDVYKIGMTRRLEPLDRVKELGDASVPFTFDVHAMIFSEDAPTLENALHRSFHHKRLNKVNERKEFFNVTLNEVADVVTRNHNKVVEFTKIAQAEQYRESLMITKEQEKIAN